MVVGTGDFFFLKSFRNDTFVSPLIVDVLGPPVLATGEEIVDVRVAALFFV